MKLGIRGHDLPGATPDALADSLTACGLDCLQLVCHKSFAGIPPEAGRIPPGALAEIGDSLRRRGVELALLGAYFNPVHSHTAEVERGVGLFTHYMQNAAALGAPMVASETGSYQDEPWIYHPQNRTPQARARIVETFRTLCAEGARHGVNVGIEGAAGHVCYDVPTLAAAVNEIACDNLRVVFDLYNFLDGSNAGQYREILEQGLQAFSGRIAVFHIKDCHLTAGEPVQCPPGQGDLDLGYILRRIRDYDKDAVLILEDTTAPDIIPAAALIRSLWG